ncbi:MAG TPA: hypothetical protein PLK33_03685 [bacterium]|jgi:vacuolar-type H+-ATPase subunit H|nr:hypothetical protein [Dictyoglomota bacterium]HHV80654.1 hypothetical protein [bacterium]HOK29227.1 hypothetical protein [bacterium]HOL54414.1 hypothetical protein [bacterium]HON73358.1 hypothetical protein [bacterium]
MKTEEILNQIQGLEREKERIVTEARNKAQEIIETAKKEAAENINAARLNIEEERKLAIDKTRKEIEKLKEQMVRENALCIDKFNALIKERYQDLISEIKEKVIG